MKRLDFQKIAMVSLIGCAMGLSSSVQAAKTPLHPPAVKAKCTKNIASTNIPSDRRYSKDHEWVKQDGANFQVGMTEFAQEQLTDVTLVDVYVSPGTQIAQANSVGTIESVKTASDLYTPISGMIVEVNSVPHDQPEAVNNAPYDTWLYKVHPSSSAEYDALMDAAAYVAFLGTLDH